VLSKVDKWRRSCVVNLCIGVFLSIVSAKQTKPLPAHNRRLKSGADDSKLSAEIQNVARQRSNNSLMLYLMHLEIYAIHVGSREAP